VLQQELLAGYSTAKMILGFVSAVPFPGAVGNRPYSQPPFREGRVCLQKEASESKSSSS
jgi:hypothetical protein